MAEVTFLEPQERVITNPFLEIPLAEDSTAITPVSPTSGLTERPLQDAFSPQHSRPESVAPVLEGEVILSQPQAFESSSEWSERMRQEWAEEDERRIEQYAAEDRVYDRTQAEIEAQAPRKRPLNAETVGKTIGIVGGIAQGIGEFQQLRQEGAGFFEASGAATGTVVGSSAASAVVGKAAAKAVAGSSLTGVGAVAAGVAGAAATVGAGIIGGEVGGAVGGAIGKALDELGDWFNPDEQHNPAEDISGPDTPVAPTDGPGSEPVDRPVVDNPQDVPPFEDERPQNGDRYNSPDYGPVGGVKINVDWLGPGGRIFNVYSYSYFQYKPDTAPDNWEFTWTNCAGETNTSRDMRTQEPTVIMLESGVCEVREPEPEPNPQPTREPKQPGPRPTSPPRFTPVGNPLRGLPLPDFELPTVPTGEPSPVTDPLTPGNPKTKPTPESEPGDLPAPAPQPTAEPRSPTAPTDAPKNPSAGPGGSPSSGPTATGSPGGSGSPIGGGSSSGSGSSPTVSPDEPVDYTPDLPGRDPEYKPDNNPTEQPQLEPITQPPDVDEADTPEECDPCKKLDEVLALLKGEFSNTIQLTNCEETENTYAGAITDSGFAGLSATNQLILDGVTEIWNQIKCGDDGGYGSVPESFIAKAPTIKPQLQVQFKEQGKKSGSRWHITIPHFDESKKDIVNFDPYLRGNVRCVLALSDNTKIIVNAASKSVGRGIIAQCLGYVLGSYQVPLTHISYYEIPSREIRKIIVEATYCKYFSGALEDAPKWTRKLPQ